MSPGGPEEPPALEADAGPADRAAEPEAAPAGGAPAGETPTGGAVPGPSLPATGADPSPPAAGPLTVAETDAVFEVIGQVAGAGAQAERKRLLAGLFGRASGPERQFLVRLLAGELHQGALEGVMTEAVGRAAGVPAGEVRRAHLLAGSLPLVAQAALAAARGPAPGSGQTAGSGPATGSGPALGS